MTPTLERGWARGISLLAAIGLVVLVTAVPRALTGVDGAPLPHALLVPLMWGISAGFVHGVGFRPEGLVLRTALGPCVAWPLMAMGLWFFIRHFST